jgi:hypothetical protein
MRNPDLTPKEILNYLREDRLIARPESGIIQFIEDTISIFNRRGIKNILKETPEEIPIGANPFMEEIDGSNN